MELVVLREKCNLHKNQNRLADKEREIKWCPRCSQIGIDDVEKLSGKEEFE